MHGIAFPFALMVRTPVVEVHHLMPSSVPFSASHAEFHEEDKKSEGRGAEQDPGCGLPPDLRVRTDHLHRSRRVA